VAIQRTETTQTGPAWRRAAFVYPAGPMAAEGGRLVVEVGPGRGDFLLHMAEADPLPSFAGIEIKGKRVDKIIRRIERKGLANVTVIQDDARDALPRHFAEGTVDEVHIHFPDPWPKKRHTKHRPINEDFLRDCVRALKAGGTIDFVTDHRPYAELAAELFVRTEGLAGCYRNTIETEVPNAFPTFFSEKWKSEGRRIYYQRYRKVATRRASARP